LGACVLVFALRTAVTAAETTTAAPAPTAAPTRPAVVREKVRVLASYPHDPAAFTQGLLLDDGFLLESTGLYGHSSLRRVELQSGKVVRKVDLPEQLFGEGLALADGHLFQLTWRAHKALVYDPNTFARVGELSYATEGWGLCFDGKRLILSDGSDHLYFHDPHTFARIGSQEVELAGRRLTQLNELECVGGKVYANVWMSDRIVEIDPNDGAVGALIDANALFSPAERAALGPDAVLNGIAYDPADQTFLLTGKLWPKIFRVRFVPAGAP
jgi:glutaminyl-peptide cyclotransferase